MNIFGHWTLGRWRVGLIGGGLVGAVAYLEGAFGAGSLPPAGRASLHVLEGASPEQIWALASGLSAEVQLGTVYVIKSSRTAPVWYLGAKTYAPDEPPNIATWVITGPRTRPAAVYSVDPAAGRLSIWPASPRLAVSSVDEEALVLAAALREAGDEEGRPADAGPRNEKHGRASPPHRRAGGHHTTDGRSRPGAASPPSLEDDPTRVVRLHPNPSLDASDVHRRSDQSSDPPLPTTRRRPLGASRAENRRRPPPDCGRDRAGLRTLEGRGAPR